jgi:hypothetical protein
MFFLDAEFRRGPLFRTSSPDVVWKYRPRFECLPRVHNFFVNSLPTKTFPLSSLKYRSFVEAVLLRDIKSNAYNWSIFFALCCAILFLAYLCVPASWIEPWRIAHQFNIPTSHVHWKAKPITCDFIRSPIGFKGCRYELSPAGYNAVGELVAGDGAPLFRRDSATGQDEVSYDHGNSWHARGRNTGTKVSMVVVNWVRVDN